MPTVAEKFRAGLRLLLAAAAIACCVCCLPGCASFGSAGNSASISAVPASADAYVPGELVVGVDASRLGASRAADDIASLGFDVNSVLLHAPNGDASVLLVRTGEDAQGGSGLAAAAELVGSLPGVSFVQPNYRYATMADSAADAVGDPDAARQYYLDSWVDSHGANVAQAWEVLGSGSEVDVAVLDTGMYSMADYLDGSLVQNDPQNFHQEFDAGNLDMADARDFVHSGDGDLLPLVNEYNPTGDDNGHGTHVSGIIAAGSTAGGKGAVGMAGVSPFARIIPCKVFDAGGEGDTADIVRAYEYLMSGEFPNLKVVNLSASLSFSADEAESEPEDVTPAVEIDPEDAGEEVEFVDGDQETSDEALHQAIKQALDSGIVTVCAAGNESSQEATYPGDYDECVCVVALDENGGLASYSNVNENKDIAAPGSGIYSAWATQADSYAQLDGTSQATAIVSGVLAMMFSAKPDLAANDAKQALYDTAWKSVQVGNGALDAGAALQLVKTGSFTKEDDPTADDPAVDDPTADDPTADDPAADNPTVEKPAVNPVSDNPIFIPKSLARAKVNLAQTKFVYTGKQAIPQVMVTVDGMALSKGVDYTMVCSNNVKPGKATVMILGTGNYTGVKTATYKIAPGQAKVKKVLAGKKSFTVKWARQKAGKVGYQVRYSLKSSMKGAKKKTVKANATTKLKVGKLKSKKTYYVQVRTFKKIGGKKYYSAWSAKKRVKVK